MKKYWVLGLFVLAIALLSVTRLSTAQPLQVRVDRWLEVRQVVGTATYQRGQSSQPARVGTRLQAVGDLVRTGSRSSTVLAVDTGIGFVNVSENTTVQIQELQQAANGGRITRLRVTGGQARLQVRPFTNPNTRLEIQTPAGLSAVRGTEFGVGVGPDGKTGVATLEGRVVTSAEGRTVSIGAGLQSLVLPGEPPLPPVPLREDTRLNVTVLATVDRQTARVAGQIDPFNVLMIGNNPTTTDRIGQFDITVPLPNNRRVEAVVITPLGKRQLYELAVP